jgi:uncharacterized protein (UPF0261 family)
MAGARVKPPTIVVIGTLDTKGREIAYVRERIERYGGRGLVVDSGILGEPVGIAPDVSREQVAQAGGSELEAIRNAGSRGAAVEMMEAGVRATCLRLWREGSLDGVLCLGGAEGALLGAAAMHALPLGIPKVIVSPTASGKRQFGPLMGYSDVLVMHSVVDILGLNPIATAVFDNAAAAVLGMARDAGSVVNAEGSNAVAVTMLGQTTPGVMKLREHLKRHGLETIVFHANGVGGPAMETLAEDGSLQGVIDFTLSELANTLMNGIHATGSERLRVVGRLGLPYVVVPGCVDFFNQGVPVPELYRSRKLYYHNPVATLVRLESGEMIELAEMVAERLNETTTGRTAVVLPTLGFSLSGVEGEPLWDGEANSAFTDTLENQLSDEIRTQRVDADVNDDAVARAAAGQFVALMNERAVV